MTVELVTQKQNAEIVRQKDILVFHVKGHVVLCEDVGPLVLIEAETKSLAISRCPTIKDKLLRIQYGERREIAALHIGFRLLNELGIRDAPHILDAITPVRVRPFNAFDQVAESMPFCTHFRRPFFAAFFSAFFSSTSKRRTPSITGASAL